MAASSRRRRRRRRSHPVAAATAADAWRTKEKAVKYFVVSRTERTSRYFADFALVK